MQPAIIKVTQLEVSDTDIVVDKRPPYIIDRTLNIMHIGSSAGDKTLGIIMNWGNHPHCLGGDIISSDFYHYWREGVESGIIYNEEIKANGIGGIAICLNGAVGGHIVIGKSVYDPWLKE